MKLLYVIVCAFVLESSRALINRNLKYQDNWRWIAYPRPRHVSVNDTHPTEEEKVRVRRNPNRSYQPNWRWIAYARSGDVSVNDIQPNEEAKQQTTPNPVSVLPTIEMYKNHQHAKPKTDAVDHEKYDLQFNRSLYQGWYQTPASLTVKNTLLFGGPWGSSNQTDHDDTINTCNIAEITMCNDDNNIPGESRQCFRNSDSITSYAMHLFNVTADKVQVLKVDEKAAQLPFPNEFNVTISSVNHINGCDGNPIVCHSMMTNSSECDTVYLCHSVKGTTVEQVTVDFNDEVNGVKLYAMCHMDTHNFGKEHVAFRMLQKHPGDSICHFISPNSFLVCKT